jgi:hypothetical protein
MQIVALHAELARVDEALARRDALTDAPNRYTAIYRACTRAGDADAAEAKLITVERERLATITDLRDLLDRESQKLKKAEEANDSLYKSFKVMTAMDQRSATRADAALRAALAGKGEKP